VIQNEVAWFQHVLETRLHYYFEKDTYIDILTLPAPVLSKSPSLYAQFVMQNGLEPLERLCLVLAMLAHIKPEVLDLFYIKNQQLDRNYTEFGGWIGRSHSGFLPTVETFLFVVSGGELSGRLSALSLFDDEASLIKYKVITFVTEHQDEPF
jgi:hypothetical protein